MLKLLTLYTSNINCSTQETGKTTRKTRGALLCYNVRYINHQSNCLFYLDLSHILIFIKMMLGV